MRTFALLLLINSFAVAANDKKVPQQLTIENNSYSLCKQHTIRYAYVIKIAYVGLYMQDCDQNENLLELPDKLIRFNYQVNVKADVFIDAAEEFFSKNFNQPLSFEKTQELNRFNQLYENIQPSDYYDIYHQDGQKLKLFKNDKLLGLSENVSFAYQYFNIWFGKYPAVKPLKRNFSS